MKINSFGSKEESHKINKNNISRETNLSMPNSKVDLIIDKYGKFDQDDYLKKISETNDKENTTTIVLPKNIVFHLNNNESKKLKEAENSDNWHSNNSKKDNANSNFFGSKKDNKNEKAEKQNIDYDFLSISDIVFDSEKDFRFIGFMSRKKLELEKDFDMGHIYKYDSGSEKILINLDGRKVKVKLFLEANKFTAFNLMTDFKSGNAKFFPIVNLDFDFISARIFIDVEKKIFRIITLGNDTVFNFTIQNKASFLTIANKVSLLIKNSKGYTNAILSMALRKEFYKVFLINN